MAKEVRVGLIGYQFMGKAHSHAYRDVSMFFDLDAVPVMKAICGRRENAVAQAAIRFGWEGYETSWERLIKRDDIDLVDISTPGDTHREIAVAAAEAGKHIFCEKPLANNLAQAREMLQAAEEAKVKHMVAFNYRRVPAVGLAKRLIDEGRIGKVYHWRAVYLQDWIMDPDFPLVWRLQKEKAGSGPHGDLNAHIIDLAHYLVGDISEVVGTAETFIKRRPLVTATDEALGAKAGREMGEVTVDDATLFIARFANGALGTFEATRFAGGRKNHNRFEINGSKGSIVFNLERLDELQYYSREDEPHIQGFKTILVTEGVHPYISAWWPPGHIIGWEHTFIHEVKDLMDAIAGDRMPSPSFADGVKCQAVLEAVSKSVEERSWVKVSEL
ncbi:MAG TPA: Gfo/Idh/MocA family oxidoreductase [Candidatus Latescibacteria bacterium]|nr:Gfo/Idh/MocA family oxidoreductase [Candidatus Latescibacterota bacterium]